jgi:lysozyme family protein
VGRVVFNKRDMLRGVALLPLAGWGAKLGAQDGNLLGLPVPKEILDILPRKPLNYVRLADAVLRLEREAERKAIPDSVLSRNTGQPIVTVDDALYLLVLPRLVALIDRAETIDIALADKAGALLADIHQSQHELPEALRLAPPDFDRLSFAGSEASFILPARAAGDLPPIDTRPLPDVEVQLPHRDADAPSQHDSDDGRPVIDLPAPIEPTKPETLPEAEPDLPLSKAKDYATLRDEYGRLYRKLTVRPERIEALDWHLAMIRKSRSRYENVSNQTGVPWYFIAVTHGLEASFNFRAHLHNGDFPLSSRTRQVPAGRPTKWLPPSDWESSAKDALRLLGFTGQKDWSLERTLYRLEAYNGFGYRGFGVPTPYLWSFSNHYDRGKYVADGKFSTTARSQQCGAAVMLKMLAEAGDLKWSTVEG